MYKQLVVKQHKFEPRALGPRAQLLEAQCQAPWPWGNFHATAAWILSKWSTSTGRLGCKVRKGMSSAPQILEYSVKEPMNLSYNIFLFSAVHKWSHHKSQQDYVQLGKVVFKLGPLELEIRFFFLLLILFVCVLVQRPINCPTSQNYFLL